MKIIFIKNVIDNNTKKNENSKSLKLKLIKLIKNLFLLKKTLFIFVNHVLNFRIKRNLFSLISGLILRFSNKRHILYNSGVIGRFETCRMVIGIPHKSFLLYKIIK